LNNEGGYLSRRLLDVLFTGQLILVVIAVVLVVGYTIRTGQEVRQISERQTLILQQQNNFQICNQHDMLLALNDISRKLGLPPNDFVIPDIEGLNCP
jgi:hypothetical protein